MLPSTGYFKTINCPFYEGGTCDRPYCHFKHSRREDGSNAGVMAGAPEVRSMGQTQETKNTDSEVLQQLVTEAVKKVLADREVTDNTGFPTNVVSQVVQGLQPNLTSDPSRSTIETVASKVAGQGDIRPQINKPVPCVYNPTPIAELRKRHIPIISYMPTRERGVAVKRKSSPDGTRPWLSLGGESADTRTPVRYKPTAIVNADDSVQTYVPTSKSDSVSSNSYEDGNSNDCLKLREPYYPKSKKRREEYVPKKVKAPLKTVGPFSEQFGMIDEILSATRIPDEESQDSCLDFEPKFSDDDNDEQLLGKIQAFQIVQDQVRDAAGEDNENLLVEETDKSTKGNESNSDVSSSSEVRDIVEKQTMERKLGNDESENKGTMKEDGKHKSSKIGKNESGSKKNGVGNMKKHRSKERSSSENGKSSTSKNKERHKSESNTNDRRSTSRGTEKETRRGSRNSKRKDEVLKRSKDRVKDKDKDKDKDKGKDRHRRDRDRHRNKEKDTDGDRARDKEGKRSSRNKDKDKKDDGNRTSEKRREQSRRNKERKDAKNDEERKRDSRSKRKSTESKGSSEKPKKRKGNSEERYLSDRSVSSLGSIGSFLDDNIFNDENYENDVDEVLSVSDSDHDVQEECLKIFQEYQVSEGRKTISTKETKSNDQTPERIEEIGRKRVAHPSAVAISRQQGVSQPSRKSVNPHQKMYERWRLMREAAENAEKAVEKSCVIAQPVDRTTGSTTGVSNNIRKSMEATLTTCNSNSHLNGNGRIRIAHVPYARSLALEKKKVAENVGKSAEAKTGEKTAAQTAKCGVRVAHVPQVVPQLIRPEPLQVTTQKFPLNVRQYYVNIMHDVCVQIYTNAEDAAQRAVKEEFSCHERCKALSVYKNSCMLATHRLRKEVDQSQNQSECSASGGTLSVGGSMVSHEAVLTGKSKGSWSVLKTKRSVTEFKGASLYCMLKKWILTEQQMRDNGYPRPHVDGQKGRAHVYVINSRNQSIVSKVPNERYCSRCGQAYMVDKHGFAVRQQNCIYHWGRKFTIRGEGKYSCCQQYGSATGCCDAKNHVWDYTDYENLRGYVKTLPKDIPIEEQGVYALDCEMCYTTQGLELTRITVIDQDCSVVYETFVRPQNPIIDYNTRFSGITEEHMKDVTTSLLDVQATLLTMFSDKSILVGHSLESDFKALRLLHDTVVDTSVMFSHKNGYPQKRALKNLCSEYLRKIIQNDVGGHDSNEDAVSCMELILWKVKEEAKLQ